MAKETNSDQTKTRVRLSIVWLLPLLALFLSGNVAFGNYFGTSMLRAMSNGSIFDFSTGATSFAFFIVTTFCFIFWVLMLFVFLAGLSQQTESRLLSYVDLLWYPFGLLAVVLVLLSNERLALRGLFGDQVSFSATLSVNLSQRLSRQKLVDDCTPSPFDERVPANIFDVCEVILMLDNASQRRLSQSSVDHL